MRRGVLLAIICAVALGAGLPAQDGYKIVVNRSNAVSSLSKDQVSKLFTGKSAWDNGAMVSPVDLLPASPVRAVFSRDIFGMPVSAVIERSGHEAAAGQPVVVASDRDVLAYVRLKPGAIGYVSAGADVQGVKVVEIGKASFATEAQSATPEKLVDVPPIYPAMARTARIQGAVDLVIVIGPSGNVEQARVVSSPPLLAEAALAAVKQWKYRPTQRNGVAVPVSTVVRISFVL